MNTKEWGLVRQAFESALLLEEGARVVHIQQQLAATPHLVEDALGLLASSQGLGGFLEGPPLAHLHDLLADTLEPPPQSDRSRIGPYQVLRLLGEGGVGVVYLARKEDQDCLPPVAVKLLKGGMNSPSLQQRFEMERRILGALQHPNIARLLDSGMTEDGEPYLVMEYVEGQRLLDHAQGLGLESRLQLFLTVCKAVAYAHQHLVIHRDIKPSNILVTAEGEPKLLDFGIAKLLAHGPDTPTATAPSSRMLTPAYASPEQLRGIPLSTASDVYSLGILLCELATGQRPFEKSSSDSESAPALDMSRDPGALFPALPTDLAWILVKALHQEPIARYTSVEQLAADLERWLSGCPVEARHGGVFYRTAKLLRRNPTSVAAVMFVLAALTLGGASTIWQARVARRAQANTERRERDLRRLTHAMMLEFDEALQELPGAHGARELLIHRAMEYLTTLEKDTGQTPHLLRDLALAHDRLGDFQRWNYTTKPEAPDTALANFEKSFRIREQLLARAPGDPDLRSIMGESHWRLSRVLSQLGRFQEHLARVITAREMHSRLLDEHPGSPFYMAQLAADEQTLGWAYLYQDQPTEARAAFLRALDLRSRLSLIDPPSGPQFRPSRLATALRNLAFAKRRLGDGDGAMALVAEALTQNQRSMEAYPGNLRYAQDLQRSHTQLGGILSEQGFSARAEVHLRKAASMGEQLLLANPRDGEVRIRTCISRIELGRHLVRTEKRPEARQHLDQALQILEPWTIDSPSHMLIRVDLADAYHLMALAHDRREPEFRIWLSRSLGVWEGLEQAGCLAPAFRSRVLEVRRALAGGSSPVPRTPPMGW